MTVHVASTDYELLTPPDVAGMLFGPDYELLTPFYPITDIMELDYELVNPYGDECPECPECPDPPDETPPEVTFVSPLPGNTIGLDDPLIVEVTDNLGALSRALLVAYIHDTGVQELVYDGDAFTARYVAQSLKEIITNGFRFTLRRTGGWPNQTFVTVRVFAVDVVGNTES